MSVFHASYRGAPETAKVAEVDPAGMVQLTIVLHPGAPVHPATHAGGHGMTHEEYRHRRGTKPAAIERIRQVAKRFGLSVVSEEPGAHIVKLRGTYAQAMEAFQPEHLGVFADEAGGRYVARSGHLTLPQEIEADVVAVMGFDQRRVANTHFRRRKHKPTPAPVPAPTAAPTANTSYLPAQVAQAYQFPTGLDGSGQTIALIELGGGYADDQIASYFTASGINRTGTVISVPVDGATNTQDDNPNGADGEVQLDIEVAGSVAPGANIAVYFGLNQGSGLQDVFAAAINDTTNAPCVISCSWGGPESTYAQQDLDALNQTLAQAAALGITVCSASGDSGSSDGVSGGGNQVDFPASSPNVLGCGGTSLPPGGPEIAWNDRAGGGASGGGYSTVFALPAWQTGVQGTQRGVPDVAGDADPATGYEVSVDGSQAVIGGTSAVAPLWAGLVALVNQSIGNRVGFINPVLYANTAAFTDITAGNNGAYQAGAGWDPVTGLGSPIGTRILAVLKAASATAPPAS